MMRIIVAGSRSAEETHVRVALRRCPWIGFATAVVSGTAKGADVIGERWAEEQGIEVVRVPAEWEKYGRRAGPMRNAEMAERAEGLIAVWDGVSNGTRHMIDVATKRGLRVVVYRYDTDELVKTEATGPMLARWEDAEERAAMFEFGDGLTRAEAERRAGTMARA